jgi:hypothetical protein
MPEAEPGIILIAQPGRMRASLPVLLKALFPTIPVELCEDLDGASRLFSSGCSHLVLIDADLPYDEGWGIAADMVRIYPSQRFLLLAHHTYQLDRAQSSGFRVLLVEGISSKILSDIIEGFIKG